jgi:thioredoxin-like negative regulator of GroEL
MNLTDIDLKTFIELQKKGNVLLLFRADWCPLCILLIETFKELARKFDGKPFFAMVDIDREKQLVSMFGVSGVPTVVAVYEQKIMDIRTGFRETEEYIDMIYHLNA